MVRHYRDIATSCLIARDRSALAYRSAPRARQLVGPTAPRRSLASDRARADGVVGTTSASDFIRHHLVARPVDVLLGVGQAKPNVLEFVRVGEEIAPTRVMTSPPFACLNVSRALVALAASISNVISVWLRSRRER